MHREPGTGAGSTVIVSTKSRFSHFYWSMCLGVVPSSCWSFLCDQMCTDRAVSCPGDSSYGTAREVGPINTSKQHAKEILGIASKIFFFTLSSVFFMFSVKISHICPISLAKVSGSPWNKSGRPKKC